MMNSLWQLNAARRSFARRSFGASSWAPAMAGSSPGADGSRGENSDDGGSMAKSDTESVISIDRSSLILPGRQEMGKNEKVSKEPITELVKHLRSLIEFRGGPLTVAEYMTEVLTHPTEGYYTTQKVFGSSGDFITSPEISQMFGEMVGIWCVAMWNQMGRPKGLRIVELGPGRGTLMQDLLRGTSAFPEFIRSINVHLVEISRKLRQIQSENLQIGEDGASSWGGVPISWHDHLDDLYNDGTPTLYIGHEFLDALPVHQFVKTKSGSWCEAMVDLDASAHNPNHFRFVLSPFDTFASKTVLPSRLEDLGKDAIENLQGLEVSAACMALAHTLTTRIAREGGAALLIDYGQNAPYEASLTAIKDHEFVDILSHPGRADLSAYVDFSAISLAVNKAAEASGQNVGMYGPIDQSSLSEISRHRRQISIAYVHFRRNSAEGAYLRIHAIDWGVNFYL